MSCENCPLQGRPLVAPEGNPSTCKYVIIGDSPKYDSARLKRPFVGKAGILLDRILAAKGIDRKDCFLTTVVKCHPPRNKMPPGAVKACRAVLMGELKQVPPHLPWLVMGREARDALFPGRFKKGVMAHRGWHTWKIAVGSREVLSTLHPASVLFNPDSVVQLMTDIDRYKHGKKAPLECAYRVVDSLPLLKKLIELLSKFEGKYVSFDLETDQINFQRDRVLCIGIGVGDGRAFMIPDTLLYADGELTDGGNLQCLERNHSTMGLLEQLFALPVRWVGHNARFDLRFLFGQFGLERARVDFDTLLAHYALNEQKGTHGLKKLADEYFDVGDYEAELHNHLSKKSDTYSKVPRDVLYKYCAMDVEITQRLAGIFEEQLRRQGLYDRPFLFPLMSANPLLLTMEVNGIQIDWEGLAEIDVDLEREIGISKALLQSLSGHEDLNPLSPKQVNNILYDEMGFPIIEVRTRAAGKRIKSRSGQAAVVDGWETLWKAGDLPVEEDAWAFVMELKHYRHLKKMQGSYIRKWVKYRGTDDRVHPSYLLFGTVTGRLSVKDPPVQTIPSKVREGWGLRVARLHTHRPGYKLLYADYSQGELMIAACLSMDPFMLKTFRKGDVDYHGEVAAEAFGPDFTRDDRQACKRFTFGWLYRGNVAEIATKALQFAGELADELARKWDTMFAGFEVWADRQAATMMKQGYVANMVGRRRRYPLLTRGNAGKAKRVAVNAPIQANLSDLNLIAAMRLHALGHQVVLLIHDSLVLEVPEDQAEAIKPAMKVIMEGVAQEYFPQVPFKADVKIIDNLSEA